MQNMEIMILSEITQSKLEHGLSEHYLCCIFNLILVQAEQDIVQILVDYSCLEFNGASEYVWCWLVIQYITSLQPIQF